MNALFFIFLYLAFFISAYSHNISGDPDHPHYDYSVKPPERISPAWNVAQAEIQNRSLPTNSSVSTPPTQAIPFQFFAPQVKVRWDPFFLYVESNGMPLHGMMVGITAWQQQVPIPQPYVGENAWRIPLHPTVATQPLSIKNRFMRGAIALAANGIPIFNPQNNRGEISQEIGELDQWGGHCGRADDYHYHAAPLHLQKIVGETQPIAFALDGYAIFGLKEPDGSSPENLDEFQGHSTPGLGYHYHASIRYPYVNGGFHGEVTEREGQVDPQPRAQPIRPATPPLRGASITQFTASPDGKGYSLNYLQNGKNGTVDYTLLSGGSWKFQSIDSDGASHEQIYSSSNKQGKTPQPEPPNRPPPPPALEPVRSNSGRSTFIAPRTGSMILHSSEVSEGGAIPIDYTGDGEGSTLPLDWSGVPTGTKCFALIMSHLDPEGNAKWYWTLYNIPADVHSIPKNVKGIGTLGNNSVNNQSGYAPPHSKGPGVKRYTLTLYALAEYPKITLPNSKVSRDLLLAAIKNDILDSAELTFTYDRTGIIQKSGESVERAERK